MMLLLDPNVWIADTGATVHATPNSSAMVKKNDRNGNDSVTMGNGKSEATEWYDDLPVTLCDVEGNTKGDSKNDSRGLCANFKIQFIQSHKNDYQQLDSWRGRKQYLT
jgi:hypothetical protein